MHFKQILKIEQIGINKFLLLKGDYNKKLNKLIEQYDDEKI